MGERVHMAISDLFCLGNNTVGPWARIELSGLSFFNDATHRDVKQRLFLDPNNGVRCLLLHCFHSELGRQTTPFCLVDGWLSVSSNRDPTHSIPYGSLATSCDERFLSEEK